VQFANYGILCGRVNQAGLIRNANGTRQESYPQYKNATNVTGKVIPPVVSPVCKKKKGDRAVISHEDVSHVGVVVGADGVLDILASSEQG
jgi:hypothetical protein